jgi:hypothetical protein
MVEGTHRNPNALRLIMSLNTRVACDNHYNKAIIKSSGNITLREGLVSFILVISAHFIQYPAQNQHSKNDQRRNT